MSTDPVTAAYEQDQTLRKGAPVQLIAAPSTEESRALIPTTALEPYEGTPDADEPKRFPIPGPSRFGGMEFLEAPELAEVGTRLIASAEHYLNHLRPSQVKIGYYWKAKGGKKGGRATLGKTSKLAGFTDYLSDHEFTVFISADNCLAANLTERQMDALVYHELSHIQYVTTDEDMLEGGLKIVGHDLEEFHAVLRLYGDWEPALTEAKDILQGRMDLRADDAEDEE